MFPAVIPPKHQAKSEKHPGRKKRSAIAADSEQTTTPGGHLNGLCRQKRRSPNPSKNSSPLGGEFFLSAQTGDRILTGTGIEGEKCCTLETNPFPRIEFQFN
ncbi:hypothetical protein [Phormidium sp. CCY1219]|uniref:hypothetical protein n=1 Tax=Phormidium sp. CCY1219 TaxID=2886104 RepID=UPI002D1F5A47|nr:hypothetical protein [Phormidium sp. CCY1219]MEB3828633.1 hypothetical protein [Phormidium sp. CCY1219]